MGLELYRKKRNFRATPEPAGRVAPRKGKALSFVIQKHAASHLHYDFRLELNGVLLSWAVPKGPSLDPRDKRLALHVEDHPIEYGDFEGVIPPQQYGSGTVLVWDRGTWLPKGDPEEGYREGKLKFDLYGVKLQGGWTLVRSRSGKYGGDKSWLLIKEKDEFARPVEAGSVVAGEPNSVATGRSLEEIAADPDRVWHSNKSVAANLETGAVRRRKPRLAPGKLKSARKSAPPALIEPQLATLVKEVPAGDGWLHELKFDGYRMLCRIERGLAGMHSRSGKDWSASFPSLVRGAARLQVESAWLDGEVVVLEADGRTSFQALQNALSRQDTAKLFYYVFDLPYLNGYDLRRAPLVERKRLLETLLESPPAMLRFSKHVEGSGQAFLDEACRMKLEGIIAKRADSTYQAGRGRNWLKVKCALRQEMVIGGFTDPEGARSGLGALHLGVYEPDGTLRYSGKVGTGFNEDSLAGLRKRLDALIRDAPPFSNPPRGAEARRSHWVKPELVAEIAFTEWTDEGTLRHPSFQGLREDKKASEVVRERPADATSSLAAERRVRAPQRAQGSRTDERSSGTPGHVVAGVALSNPDKLLYPEAGITKLEIARFYDSIAEWVLPHLAARPLTLVRCPNGWSKHCFFQKNADAGVDEAIERVEVQTSDGPAQYMMANSKRALIALVQMGALELHPWGSRAGKLHFPDRIVLDLDPDDGVGWERVVEAVSLVRALLGELGLRSFLKTTGGKGLHVVLPIRPTLGWEPVKGFCKAIADLLARTFPDRFTAKASKATREGKIFIDYLRNSEGATAISAYSIRARANAPVATPLAWEELEKDVRFDHFNLRTLPRRLQRLQADPWAEFFSARQSVTQAMMRKAGLAEAPAKHRRAARR